MQTLCTPRKRSDPARRYRGSEILGYPRNFDYRKFWAGSEISWRFAPIMKTLLTPRKQAKPCPGSFGVTRTCVPTTDHELSLSLSLSQIICMTWVHLCMCICSSFPQYLQGAPLLNSAVALSTQNKYKISPTSASFFLFLIGGVKPPVLPFMMRRHCL